MSSLEKAKEQMELIDGKDMNEDIRRTQIAQSYATIYIAEQLERMNNQTYRIEQSDIYKYIVREDK